MPQHIKEVLQSRYEYVVAEKDVVTDLTDSLRLCKNCGECEKRRSVMFICGMMSAGIGYDLKFFNIAVEDSRDEIY